MLYWKEKTLEGVVNEKLKYTALFLAILTVAFLGAGNASANAKENLLQTGIVKSVDMATRTVIIDVKSESCFGVRIFTSDDPDEFEHLVNKKINFIIDSPVCKHDIVYKVMLSGGNE